MQASDQLLGGCGQRSAAGGVVPELSCPLEGGISDSQGQSSAQGQRTARPGGDSRSSTVLGSATTSTRTFQLGKPSVSSGEPAVDAQGRIGPEGEKAIQQNQTMLQEQEEVHAAQRKYLEDQVLWMSVVAGEERMQKAMNDPAFHQGR